MTIDDFLSQLALKPESISFNDTMQCIDQNYDFKPSTFKNGSTINPAGENNGSCKIFAFATHHNISQQDTLHCFGDYYRIDVLKHPSKDNHQNIRNFITQGWTGLTFEASALDVLTPKF